MLSSCLFMYHWSGKTDVTLPWVWLQKRLVLDATCSVWAFKMMSFSDVTFSIMKFHIMKRKWRDISSSHSGVSKDLIFGGWDDVFLGGCYPTFRYIHVPLCSYLMSWRTRLFEHWKWSHYDPLKDELLTERNCVISRKTRNSSSHVSENLWYYGRLSVVAVRMFSAIDICMHMLATHPIILRIRWLWSA
jgi:hypothetical protein